MSSAKPNTTSGTSPTKVASLANEVLEEDDEFEEFDLQDWNSGAKDTEDSSWWKNDWDDDDGADDNFVKQLRAELKQ